MVINRHHNCSGKKTGAIVRAGVCVCVFIALSACGGSGSSGTDDGTADTSAGQTNIGQALGESDAGPDAADLTGGLADDPNGTSGNAGGSGGQSTSLPATAQPMAIRLVTAEEVAIDGSFVLIGESDIAMFEQQRFSIITQPRNGTVIHAESSRQFTYAPEEDFFGEDEFIYSIGPSLAARVTVEVINVNDPPLIFDDVQRVIEQGTTYTELLIARDPDNDPLTYSSANLPSWLNLDASTGLLSGTPTQADVGLFENISFSVSDEEGLSSAVTDIRIEVIDINDAPTINVDQFPVSLDAAEEVRVNLYPDDPDGDLVKVSVEPNDFLDLNVTGSTVQVVANEVTEVTEVNLVVRATDLLGHVAREIIPLTIYPINDTGRGRTIRGRSSGEGVHLIVLGDGYREDQQKQFRLDIEAFLKKMRGDIGMLTHLSAWNVHMVETPSVDSGIDDQHGRDIRNTVFDTGYYCKDVGRLICGSTAKMYEVAIEEYPNFDQIVVLVNDPRYGGSGGNDVAIASSSAAEIALHEMGHSIAGLADEYVDRYIIRTSVPAFSEGRYPNVSASSDPAEVPWAHWFTSNDSQSSLDSPSRVGVFEGAFYREFGFYRPTFESLMRSYSGVLGPVNGEQWALGVYSMGNPVLDISPVNRLITKQVGEVVEFSVVPLFDSTVQSVEWRLDSQLIAHSGGKRPKVELSLPSGQYELTLKVADISGLIRKPEPHSGVFNWDWTIVVP